MEKTSGIILELEAEKETKTGNYMHILKFSDGEKYSGWDKAPKELRDAYANKTPVELDFEVKDKYRNIKKITYNVTLPEAVKTEQAKVGVKPVDAALQMDMVQDIVDSGGEIMHRCRLAVIDLLGREPENEGEPAMVNSLFIFVTKELYFRSK